MTATGQRLIPLLNYGAWWSNGTKDKDYHMTAESVENIANAIESFGTSIAWFGFWIGLGLAIIGIGIAIQNQ